MKQYNLSFTKEPSGLWYIDLPNWPFSHSNLQMVSGADKLCEELSDNGNCVSVLVTIPDTITDVVEHDIKLVRKTFDLFGGADYNVFNFILVKECWICPVTLFVFGKYPEIIYIKKK